MRAGFVPVLFTAISPELLLQCSIDRHSTEKEKAILALFLLHIYKMQTEQKLAVQGAQYYYNSCAHSCLGLCHPVIWKTTLELIPSYAIHKLSLLTRSYNAHYILIFLLETLFKEVRIATL